MIFHVLTTFPELVASVFEHGVLRRAVAAGIVEANIVNLRDFTDDKHKTTDDMPYGGGPGMVMLAEPIFRAVEHIRAEHGPVPLIYLTPSGELFTHEVAREMAGGDYISRDPENSGGTGASPVAITPQMSEEGIIGDGACATEKTGGDKLRPYADGFILLCGRYEGVDQRVIDHLVDSELSLGDYVLSGGELAAMVVIDAVARLIPGVLGNDESARSESFATGLLDWPHYTRPEAFRGHGVPEVLISGHHGKIMGFREEEALLLTYARRPELLTAEQAERAKHIMAIRRQKGQDDAGTD